MVDYVSRLSAELWPGFALIKLNDLEHHFDLTWQDLTSDTGTGEIKVPVSSPDAADIEEGTQVRCFVDGVHRFTFTVEDADKVFVARGEELEEVVHCRGRGSANIAERWLVFPYGGISAKPVVDDRVFNFGSADYDDSGWTAPADFGAQSSGPAPWTDTGSPAPLQWPDPAARWIWGDADNTADDVRTYFRTTFYVPSTKRVAIFATADDDFTVYLNGVPILAELDALWPFRLIYRKEQELPAGTYTLAAVVENTAGVGGFLASVWTISGTGNLETMLRRSDVANWVVLFDPATPPGVTPGAIMATLIDESALSTFTYDFDAVNDSNGDPWPTITDWSVPIGQSLLAVLVKLSEQGWIDWEFEHGSGIPELHAYNPEGGMTVTGVTYTAGVNIAELSHKLAEPIFTTLLVKWPRGYWVVFDVAAIVAHGTRQGFYTVDVDDFDLVIALANRQLDRVKNGDPAIVVSVEHAPDTNAEPYIDFALGDKVNAPNKTGASTSYRVLGITVVEDEMGDPSYTLELNRRGTRPVLQLFDLLRAISGGSIGALGGGTTPVTIPGGTGSTGGGSTGGGNPGDYHGTCEDPTEDALASIAPFDDSDIYVPLVCGVDSVREQRSDDTLGWGGGFDTIIDDAGDHLIRTRAGYPNVSTAVLGDLTILDGFSEDEVSVAFTWALVNPPGAAGVWVELLNFGNGIVAYAKDDGATYSMGIEFQTAAGAATVPVSGCTYFIRHQFFAVGVNGGDLTLYKNRNEVGSDPMPASPVITDSPLFVSYLPAQSTVGRIALWTRALDNDELGAIPQIRVPDPLVWDWAAAINAGARNAVFTGLVPGDVILAMSAARDSGGVIGSGMNAPATGGSTATFSAWTSLFGGVAESFDSQGASEGRARMWWAAITGAGTADLSTSHPGQALMCVVLKGADPSDPIRSEHVQAYSLNPGITLVGSAMDGTEIGFIACAGAVGASPPVFTSTNGMAVQQTTTPVPLLQSGRALAAFGLQVPGFGFSSGLTGNLGIGYDLSSGGWVAYCIGINWLDPDL